MLRHTGGSGASTLLKPKQLAILALNVLRGPLELKKHVITSE
jgi:hypothetical protein